MGLLHRDGSVEHSTSTYPSPDSDSSLKFHRKESKKNYKNYSYPQEVGTVIHYVGNATVLEQNKPRLHDNTILVVLLLVARELAVLHRLVLVAFAQFLQAFERAGELES
jgi:hypothetical protein